MANIDNNTIQLDISTDSKYLEGIADIVSPATILPGYLLAETSALGFIPHGIADGTSNCIFAVENPYQGGDINTPYTAGERVMARQCRKGDRVLAWLAEGNDVTAGEYLVSNGAGLLQIAGTPVPGSYVGVAQESINAVADARIIITVM